jgi:type II secretory pathway component PulM
MRREKKILLIITIIVMLHIALPFYWAYVAILINPSFKKIKKKKKKKKKKKNQKANGQCKIKPPEWGQVCSIILYHQLI